MTDLERARAHLLWCQTRLRIHRSAFYELEHTEDAFLAALSWVWEEQCSERRKRLMGELACL